MKGRGRFETQAHRGESPRKTEAEAEAVQPLAEHCLQLPELEGARILPSSLQREHGLATAEFGFLASTAMRG